MDRTGAVSPVALDLDSYGTSTPVSRATFDRAERLPERILSSGPTGFLSVGALITHAPYEAAGTPGSRTS